MSLDASIGATEGLLGAGVETVAALGVINTVNKLAGNATSKQRTKRRMPARRPMPVRRQTQPRKVQSIHKSGYKMHPFFTTVKRKRYTRG